VLLFVFAMMWIPDVEIAGYMVGSDSWVYFIACELVLLSSFQLYRIRLERTRQSDTMNIQMLNNLVNMLVGRDVGNVVQKFQALVTGIDIVRLFVCDVAMLFFFWVFVMHVCSRFFTSWHN